jgi:ACS family allantoate permease-like MFS transporter
MFIFFGVFTVLFGISLWWLLPDSPMSATFLSERERLIAVERLKSNKTGIKNTHHKKAQVKEALVDPKVWLLVAAVFIHNMTNSLQSNFTGIIIKGFGYTTYQAVLLSIPGPAILTVVMLSVMFFLSSKWGQEKRIFAIILCYVPGIISCAILHTVPVKSSTKGVHLFAIFIIPICAVSAGILYSLLASNVAGYTKKTVAGAMFFASYCVANIVSPQAFIAKQAPKYTTGIIVSLTCFCLNMVLMVVLYFVYDRANATREKDAAGFSSGDDSEDLVDAFSDMTDLKNKKLRYTK